MNFLSKSFNVGKYFGIPLYFHISWLLFAVLILLYAIIQGQYMALAAYPMLFLFVILHEYGHSTAAKYIFNKPVRDITIYPIGGVARIEFDSYDRKQELIITLCGPLVNFVFMFLTLPIFFFETSGSVIVDNLLLYTFALNFMLFVFNILPIFPMDGGRIFRATLQYLGLDFHRSTIIAARTGQVLAVGVGLTMFMLGSFLAPIVMFFIFMMAQKEIDSLTPIIPGVPNEMLRDALMAVAEKSGNDQVKNNPNEFLVESCAITDQEFRRKYLLDIIERDVVKSIVSQGAESIMPSILSYSARRKKDGSIEIHYTRL